MVLPSAGTPPFVQAYTERLLASGHAYECFCSEEELEAERQNLVPRENASLSGQVP